MWQPFEKKKKLNSVSTVGTKMNSVSINCLKKKVETCVKLYGARQSPQLYQSA